MKHRVVMVAAAMALVSPDSHSLNLAGFAAKFIVKSLSQRTIALGHRLRCARRS